MEIHVRELVSVAWDRPIPHRDCCRSDNRPRRPSDGRDNEEGCEDSLQRPVLARHRQSVSNGTVGSALQRVRGMATSCQRVRKQCQPRSFSGYSGGASCATVAEFAVHAGARTKHSAMGDEGQRVRDVLRRTDLPGISQVSHHPQVRTRRYSQHASDVVTGTQI